MRVQSTGDFVNGKITGVTLFLGDAFELHLSVGGRLSQGEKRLGNLSNQFYVFYCRKKINYLIVWWWRSLTFVSFRRLSLPYASHAVFVGAELGFYKLWSEEFGFTVTIDNAANIALTLTKHHANNTCGLCGNFNSVSADEYSAQEGKIIRGKWMESKVCNGVRIYGICECPRVKLWRVH